MFRLRIREKHEANTTWFQQFFLLKKQLGLSVRECIKLFWSIKKDKDILVQTVDNEKCLDLQFDAAYHELKKSFDINLDYIESGFNSLVDANHYSCYLVDRVRGFRIYISRM